MNNSVYQKVNEGIGGAYERVAYSNIIKKLASAYNCRSILELNATFIAGVPGFNSCLLAQAGYAVTLTVHARDYQDTVHAWELLGLKDRVKIIKWNDDFHTPFTDNQFDFVWNHLAFEHYRDPLPLVNEMKRVSNKIIMNLTLSPFNVGFPLHWFIHKLSGKKWDHGYFKNTLISTMEKVHKQAGLQKLESGACDNPPWMDTVDAKMGESMTYLDYSPRFIRDKWVWCSANPECQKHWLINWLWSMEKSFPEWFRRLTAHHLYTASGKTRASLDRY